MHEIGDSPPSVLKNKQLFQMCFPQQNSLMPNCGSRTMFKLKSNNSHIRSSPFIPADSNGKRRRIWKGIRRRRRRCVSSVYGRIKHLRSRKCKIKWNPFAKRKRLVGDIVYFFETILANCLPTFTLAVLYVFGIVLCCTAALLCVVVVVAL